MQRIHLGATVALLGSLLANTSYADSSGLNDFNQLDRNADGNISWQEYASRRPVSGRIHPRRIFDNVDKNLDGFIDRHEYAAMKRRAS
ncbi:EF-hand domain-containing protein [Candidatus Thiothrix anitrata]|jgi:Ca2+-binding EF-hand superfamily protein|uniref:EF-hand domain-containing protein n=1 Tax=Candidatus Thiothrix anitrata TaxID=2823902 RepID=A0ABX7WXT3_9GAMM|nr:hypothetical protein [Candidatus Thiothrix anitrata]QTR48579.1 hypothetical protein J8380_09685 [Candidatus Thiothrix anitrata]